MSEPFIGEIRIFACNYPPRSWSRCNGQLVPIAQNSAMFSILGTTYGGDGRTTFALPNLEGRAAMHPGRGPGLTSRRLGERTGAESIALSDAQIPSHNHIVNVYNAGAPLSGSQKDPQNGYTSVSAFNIRANEQMAGEMILSTGGGQPHENRMPYLGLNFCIAMQGLYPTRS